MSKKLKKKKNIGEVCIHQEVVLLNDVCDVLMKKFFQIMDILRDSVFPIEIRSNKE